MASDESDRRSGTEACMTQVIVCGIAVIVVSIGAALLAKPRPAAYTPVLQAQPRRPRVR